MSRLGTWAARLGALALAACGTAAAADGPVALRWAFREGQTLRYEFRQKIDLVGRAGGQETKVHSELRVDLVWKVRTTFPDGSAEIDQALDRVVVSVEAGPRKTEFDSGKADPTDATGVALARVYRAALAAPAVLSVDARGAVTAARVPQGLSQALEGSPFQAGADAGSFLTDAGLKALLPQILPLLPEKPLKVGDSWASAVDIPGPIVTHIELRNRLDSADADRAAFSGAVTTRLTPASGTGIEVKVRKSEGKASTEFERGRGRLARSKSTTAVVMEIVAPGGSVEQNASVEMAWTLVKGTGGGER